MDHLIHDVVIYNPSDLASSPNKSSGVNKSKPPLPELWFADRSYDLQTKIVIKMLGFGFND